MRKIGMRKMSKDRMPTMKFFSFIDIKREKNLIRSFEKKRQSKGND